jgi:hypothetical protein
VAGGTGGWVAAGSEGALSRRRRVGREAGRQGQYGALTPSMHRCSVQIILRILIENSFQMSKHVPALV